MNEALQVKMASASLLPGREAGERPALSGKHEDGEHEDGKHEDG